MRLLFFFTLLPLTAADFSGQKALEYTQALVNFGPRPSGTPAMVKTQAYIIEQLKANGWQVSDDSFSAKTPAGTLAMKNIVARKAGLSGRAVAITGHYDTKRFPFPFVGANDGGASAGVLLELSRALKDRTFKNDVYLVFFDGEEAVKDWTATDSLYGSRHLAEKWQSDGIIDRLTALVNIDMIGDRDLKIVNELYSSEPLRRVITQAAASLGYAKHFNATDLPIEDDHVPFLRKGVRAADLIDFDYGPNHAWWHTAQDTMDKLSPASMEVVGRTLTEVIKRLEP